MHVYRSAWLLPIAQPPIRDAWVRTERGRIVAFGHSRPGDITAEDEIDLGEVAVLPGLVNAHAHLELSWMRGRVPDAASFPAWIRAVIALRAQTQQQDDLVARSVESAIDEARRYGTALMGDVSNTLASSAALREQDMPALVFHELLGFPAEQASAVAAAGLAALAHVTDTDQLRHTLSPHSPYSVSPALFGEIRTALRRNPFARSSVHLGESEAEVEFLREGTGPFREMLGDLGVWDPSWVPPKCDPVEYLDRMWLLDERLLVVHGVEFREPELRHLVAKGATLVTCPRGNRLTRAGSPPIAEFFESGARIAVGTDSLASVPDLNVFAELAEMRQLAPQVPARRLLESATANGARALGFEADFGTIEAGKQDRLIAVELERDLSSVEEYLVSGIESSQIRWL
jgi:cytosine/adenosine deaminase-related metal-dependent hydrolase